MSRVTTATLQEMKEQGVKSTLLTAYDYPTARLLDEAGIDILLIGDSVGNTVLGYENTLPVTMEEMLHHTAAVSRGAERAMVVADMPFLSYQTTIADAVWNAGLFIKESGAHAVKLEGGRERADAVRAMVETGIPVMGHLGLTPPSLNSSIPVGNCTQTSIKRPSVLQPRTILKSSLYTNSGSSCLEIPIFFPSS
jgi:3-methyl-2-oxobutanoate hydroxymethyltransferase